MLGREERGKYGWGEEGGRIGKCRVGVLGREERGKYGWGEEGGRIGKCRVGVLGREQRITSDVYTLTVTLIISTSCTLLLFQVQQ